MRSNYRGKSRGLLLLVICFCSVGRLASAQEADASFIKEYPGINGPYHSTNMVRVVNRLRHLGKDKALKTLRKYCTENVGGDTTKVVLICRLLFVNPKGWEVPILGHWSPEVTTNGIKQFPLFPLALSDGVPFFLLHGYEGSGMSDPPLGCLDQCKDFAMITEDLSNKNLEAAAKHLIQSARFQELYDGSDAPKGRALLIHAMAEEMLRQAGVTNVVEPK